MSAKVLVVMRTKNRPLFLDRAIRSVAAQTYKDWHCVIVNDGGDARGVENVLASLEKDLRNSFSVVHNLKSLGMEAASNKGLAVMSAEYYAIHDDDDSWSANFLAECVSVLSNSEQRSVQGVVSRTIKVLEVVTDSKIMKKKEVPYNSNVMSFTIPRVVQNNPFMPISFLYTREALEELGGYDESLPVVGDWEFNLRFIRKFDIAYTSKTTAFYHVRVGGLQGDNSNSISSVEAHQYYRGLIVNRYLRKEMDKGTLSMAQIMVATESSLWANRFGERMASLYNRFSAFLWGVLSLGRRK